MGYAAGLVSAAETAPGSPTPRRRIGAAGIGAVLILALALAESAAALLAPLRAPDDADWRAAGAVVRGAFAPGDLVVAAPAWADPVMRLHLGDLVPIEAAGRLDDRRYARVWEISQRGADAPEAAGRRVARESRHGALTVRLHEGGGLPVTYDFFARWGEARVARTGADGRVAPCARLPDRHQCPDLDWNLVKPRLLEVGGTLHQGLLAQPVDGATLALDFPGVPLGREIAVGAGLHSVWWRRHGEGKVWLRVLVDGKEIGKQETTSRSGWQVSRFDTSSLLGRQATVRFEITTDKALARLFGFAAEARGK
jgi:hypothetical protein